jgi:hypothetical protein
MTSIQPSTTDLPALKAFHTCHFKLASSIYDFAPCDYTQEQLFQPVNEIAMPIGHGLNAQL